MLSQHGVGVKCPEDSIGMCKRKRQARACVRKKHMPASWPNGHFAPTPLCDIRGHLQLAVLFFKIVIKYNMELKQDLFVLNKFGEFKNRDLESDFMEYAKKNSLNITRVMLLFMGICFALFAFSDYYFGKEDDFILSLGFRIAGLCIAVLAFFILVRFERYEHALIIVTLTQLLIFTAYLLFLHNIENPAPDRQFMTVMLFIMTAFLIPNRWKNSLIAGTVILTGYYIFSAVSFYTGGTSGLIEILIYLGISLIVCAIFHYSRENSNRKQFAAEKLLEFMSITDKLTGIYNRGRFEFVLGTWIKNMRHNPFSLILYDIDNFKKVNDSFGHTVGDEVLIKTSEVVAANIRDEDMFARWGGEEFVVLFSGTGIERAAELAERLRKAVEVNSCGEAGTITISIGIAEYRQGETITDFVNRADEKMYEAKRAGKNRVMI